MDRIALPEKLADAVQEAKRISNFEGKRRQMQFIGKLMRKLDAADVQAIRDALLEQVQGSAQENVNLHLAEQWRDRLIADEDAFAIWFNSFPATDTQQLRALIRQARKDAPAASKAAVSQGLAPRQGRAYREIFQLVRDHLTAQPEPETETDTPTID
jgi:ribosome-associated protein